MASKYANLKGKIPTEPTEREQALIDAIRDRKDASLAELTAEYNQRELRIADLFKQAKDEGINREACETLIRSQLDALSGDAVTMNGYTWTPTSKPRASVFDRQGMIDYFLQHDMKDLLSVHAQRLDSMVAEEALANTLNVVEVPIINQETGEEQTTTEFRSQIAGVRVYLQPNLSRVKSNKGAK